MKTPVNLIYEAFKNSGKSGFNEGCMLGIENSVEYYERVDKSPFHI
jgi:hypothetical protein